MLPKLATRGLTIQSFQALCVCVCMCVGLLLEKHSPETCGWLPWFLGNLNCQKDAGRRRDTRLAVSDPNVTAVFH